MTSMTDARLIEAIARMMIWNVMMTNNYTLVRCDLGYHRCEPMPTEDELERLYSQEFYTSAKPNYIKNMERDIRWWNTMYDDRLAIMSEVYRKSSRKIFPLMLDIGCGGGFFLRRAYANKNHQWIGVGVEPNSVAREYAQNTGKVVGGCFYESSLDNVKETKFWGVHISEVLEHIREPLTMLKMAHERLVIGGVICVVVPNEKFIWDEDYGKYKLKYSHVFQPPQHINYFDFHSVVSLIEFSGFEIYEISAMYPMEIFLDLGINYVTHPELGAVAHQHRKNFDLSMNPDERREFYRECAANNIGRECVIYGVKK